MLNYSANDFDTEIEKKTLASSQALECGNATSPFKANKAIKMDVLDLALADFEKSIISDNEKTKTIFYPSNSFVVIMPSHELYRNKFESSSHFAPYLKELAMGFENINGFNIQYVDKADGIIRSWFTAYNSKEDELHLHGATNANNKQVDSKHSGKRKDFIKMILALIKISSNYEIKNATFYN
ncbi:MAG: hypothetical protein IKL52_03240 [Candidatus Gastranaerophilales bacterium]|nr:hypothetical protein [Candidatus Gastranaerophilales bacterium]